MSKPSTTKQPILTKMASDLTLRGLFAMNAPDVPDWFINKYEKEKPDRLEYPYGENKRDYDILFEKDLSAWTTIKNQVIFIKWREYYAELMINHFGK